MATDELGEAVHDNIGTVLLWLAQVWRGQRVIDDERHTRLLGDGSDRWEIDDDTAGIGNRLAEDRLGLWRDRLLERGRVRCVRPHDIPVELLERVVELVDRTSIELAPCYEFIAGLKKCMESEKLGRVARCNGERGGAPFKGCNSCLQHRLCRVRDACVDVAERLQTKQRSGVIGIIENEGCGLKDWRDAGAGRGIRG